MKFLLDQNRFTYKQYLCVSQKNHAVHCYFDYSLDNKISGSHGSEPEVRRIMPDLRMFAISNFFRFL